MFDSLTNFGITSRAFDNNICQLLKINPRDFTFDQYKRIDDKSFGGSGIGNEIAFYIFDYPPEDELRVRDYLQTLLEHIPKQKHGLRVKHINLFDLMLEYLQSRSGNLLEKALRLQQQKGDEFMKSLLEPLGQMLSAAKLRSSEIKAGCGKCGACSSLSTYET